jgi:hypothetical protein
VIAGIGAICAGLLVAFNPEVGGPLRGIPIILLGIAVVYFGVRKLREIGKPEPGPVSPATETPP